MKTMLALIQSYCRLKALEVPASLVGSTNAAELQMIEVYNKVGRHIAAYRSWENLKRRGSHTQINAEDQGALATILSEAMDHVIVDTIWNVTTQLPLTGPLSDAQ